MSTLVPKLRPNAVRLTGAQLRAARGLLDLSAEELADETKLSLKTIRRAEQAHGPVPITRANAEHIISILEGRGVQFIDANGDGAGVRLTRHPSPRFGDSKVKSRK